MLNKFKFLDKSLLNNSQKLIINYKDYIFVANMRSEV